MVKVNGQEIRFREGMTIADALREAGKSINNMTLIMLNEKVLHPIQFQNEKLVDGTHIKVFTMVSGG